MALERTIKIKVDSKGAKKDVDSLDRSVDNLDRSAKNTNESFGKLKTAVAAVAAALQIRQIAQYADAFTSIQNQIRQTTNSTQELTKRTGDLLAISQRSRVSFEATAELYTQLTLSTENLNLSTEEQLRLTETIGKSFAVSGKSAAESAGAIRQLGQAFASGALRGDEFNSIAEGAPEIMRALQRSLKLTQGELRDLAATGGITSEILVTALSGAAEVIDDKLSKSTKTLAQSFQEADGNMTAFIGSSGLVNSAVTATGNSIVFLSNNLDTIANVLLVAAVAGMSRLTVTFIANTVAMVASTTAMGAATIAATTLSRAMGLLGGPVGIILTVAASFLLFNSRQDEAKDAAELTSKAITDQTKAIKGMDQAMRDIEMQKLSDEQNELLIKIKQTSEGIKKLEENLKTIARSGKQTGFAFVEGQINGANDALKSLNNELSIVQSKLSTTFAAGLPSGTGSTTSTASAANGGGGTVAADPSINEEAFKTANLREQLNERLAIQKAFGELMVQDFKSVAEQEQAIADFNTQADLINLESRRAQAANDFALRREQLLINTQLDADAKLELTTQIDAQELLAKAQFEADKTDIERTAAEERADIARMESAQKINNLQGYANTALNLQAVFGSKSEKAQKKRRKAAVKIDAAAGIVRAFAENNFWVAIGLSAAIAATAMSQLSAIDGASSGNVSASPATGRQDSAPRQEPIQQQTIVENRGLSEVLAELQKRDPQEPIPLEFALRIAASQDTVQRLGG